MTTLTTLQANMEAARDAFRLAERAYREAQFAYDQGALEATGLKGHKVSYNYARWRKSPMLRSFLVDRTYGGSDNPKVSGYAIRADNTLGTVRYDCEIAKLTDHGPWEASK